MLERLRIRNLVIVSDLTLEFGPGLNVLTGETGAGKSILVGALELLRGARGDRQAVRSGAERAVVEATFGPVDHPALIALGDANGVDLAANEPWIVRRELAASGGSRAFINGSPCTISVLRELVAERLQVHGQHDQQGLLDPERQLRLIDRYGEHAGEVDAVSDAYDAVLAARRRLTDLEASAADRDRIAARCEDDLREIEQVAPQPGELDALDRERELVRNAERVAALLDAALELLHDGESNAASLAAAAQRKLSELGRFDGAFDELAERVASAAVELQEAGAAVRDYREHRDFEASQLDRIESRRAVLERLRLRYGDSEDAVLAHAAQLREQLEGLRDFAQGIEDARRCVEQATAGYVAAAAALSAARRSAVERLLPAIEAQLESLALPAARLSARFDLARGDRVGGIDEEVALSPRGAERLELLLAANPGEPARSLARVASGGELSRVMLAAQVAAGGGGDAVLVFDEVDSGIGGLVADAVGRRLARLARRHQVLCITHLAQVAAYADHHFRVTKRVGAGRTSAEATALAHGERIAELARMVGGRKPSAASRRHAEDLVGAARREIPGTRPEGGPR